MDAAFFSTPTHNVQLQRDEELRENIHLFNIKQAFDSSCADLTLKNPQWILESIINTPTNTLKDVLRIKVTLYIPQLLSLCFSYYQCYYF